MAMVDGQRLYDLNIELPASERKKANIYKGKITRIEPSLEAAFVDFGAERHGFLPLKEISSEYFVRPVEPGQKPSIRDVLNEGQDIVVQIDKEERGNKGAALTTFVSLAGRFIVLKPNKSRSGGVSRRIVGADRDLARHSLGEIEVPDGMSVILRTAGIDRSAEELAWDLDNLLTIWHAILNVVLQKPSPFLIYRESNAIVRALRDYLTNEIGEILIDNDKTFQEATEFVEQVMPHNLKKLKHYTDPVPLFTRFQIESQIESAFAHSVTLPSGGSIVIDHTEALVSIDINSARATKGGDIEATALNTNLEAAEEIARQLRIRDLGGLIVVDFIDMGPQKNQRAVENRLRESVRQDRARVQIGKITRFGLLEMSRQRLRPSLGDSAYLTCPRCSGFGTIRSVESLALAILRIIGEEARKERTAKVIAQLPVEVATYLLNEKRDWVRSVESRHGTQMILVANSMLETPHYEVRRVRDDQTELPENTGVSYELAEFEKESQLPTAMQERKPAEAAAISAIKPATPAPKRQKQSKGFFASLVEFFTGGDKKPTAKKSSAKKSKTGSKDRHARGGQRNRRRMESKKPSDKRGADRRRTKKKTTKKSPASSKSREAKGGAQKPRKPKQVEQSHDESQSASKTPPRPRRSRSGRRRRRTEERSTQDATAENQRQPETMDAINAAQKAVPETKADGAGAASGPPRVRTDAERRADAADQSKSGNGSSQATREPKPESRPEPKPEAKAELKAVPKPEPAPTAETKPAPAPKPEPAPKPVVASEPAPKPETAPAPGMEAKPEPKAVPKPPGRLLPWDADSPPSD